MRGHQGRFPLQAKELERDVGVPAQIGRGLIFVFVLNHQTAINPFHQLISQ